MESLEFHVVTPLGVNSKYLCVQIQAMLRHAGERARDLGVNPDMERITLSLGDHTHPDYKKGVSVIKLHVPVVGK